MSGLNQGSQLCRRLVLHVDSYSANVAIVEELVNRREDLMLLSTPTGKQALQLASARLPDVIVMEVMLHDIHGVEVVKVLRQAVGTAKIPVIALSFNALPEQVEAAMNAGFFCYLTKPFKLKDLMKAIDDAMQTNAQYLVADDALVEFED